jgi:uncharacterized protein YjbI with pentapeptide repeats
MYELTKKHKLSSRWNSQEAQNVLKEAIVILQNKKSLQEYLYSLPPTNKNQSKFWTLEGAPLNNLNLTQADFREALLSYTDFRSTNLEKADFREASIIKLIFLEQIYAELIFRIAL